MTMRHGKNVLIILTAVVFMFCGCNKTESSPYKDTASVEQNTIGVLENSIVNPETDSTNNKEMESGSEGETQNNKNYMQALSSQELKKVKKMAEDFYSGESFPYDLLSIKVADDSDPVYQYYPEYEPGNIIAFLAETTHAGRGTYRCILFARKDKDESWERINEGY